MVDKVEMSVFFQLVNIDEKFYSYNELIEFGYMNSSIYTSIIDLMKSEDEIFLELRENHRRDIKKKIDLVDCMFISQSNINMRDILLFKDFYFDTAGRRTHSDEIFNIFYKMITKENAVLVKGLVNGVVVGYIFLVVYKRQVYYLMGAQKDNTYPVIKLLLYSSIKYFKELKYNAFEIGRMEFENSIFYHTDVKRKHISSFKKGFGGNIYPIHRGIKYYTEKGIRYDVDNYLSNSVIMQ